VKANGDRLVTCIICGDGRVHDHAHSGAALGEQVDDAGVDGSGSSATRR
jgi:hypothetical protein